jgi:hypothetical protein
MVRVELVTNSSQKANVPLVDHGSNVTFHNVAGLNNGERQWVSLHYTVNNATGMSFHFHYSDSLL